VLSSDFVKTMSLLTSILKLCPVDVDDPWCRELVQGPPDPMRPTVAILDFSQKAEPIVETFGQLVEPLVLEVERHFLYAQTVVVVFDKELPPDRILAQTGQHAIPRTPFDLTPGNRNPLEAWRKSFTLSEKKQDVNQGIHNLGGRKPISHRSYSTRLCSPDWTSRMRNLHFWGFVNDFLIRNIELMVIVPSGKQLILLGLGDLRVKGRPIGSKEYFETPYQEAALATVWITEYYQRSNNVLIFSNQDKTLLANLLAQPRRIKQATNNNIEFNGLVAIARNWTHGDVSFIQVNLGKLFWGMTMHSKALPNVNLMAPVATWVFFFLFCMDSKSCFFPQLQINLLVRTFIDKLHELDMPLVQNVSSRLDVCVNSSAWLHYLFLAYQARFSSLVLDLHDMNDCFRQIREKLTSERHDFTLARFKVRVANTFWIFRSMIAAQTRTAAPDPFTIVNNESIYGYEKEGVVRETGRPIIKLSADVSLKDIDFTPAPRHVLRDASPKRRSSSD
jgi:hypothetical protein